METIQINDRDYKYKFSNAVLSAFEKQCGIRLADFDAKGTIEHQLILCFKALQITAKVEKEEFALKFEEFVDLDAKYDLCQTMWGVLSGDSKKLTASSED